VGGVDESDVQRDSLRESNALTFVVEEFADLSVPVVEEEEELLSHCSVSAFGSNKSLHVMLCVISVPISILNSARWSEVRCGWNKADD